MSDTAIAPTVDLARLNAEFPDLDYRERFGRIREQFDGNLIASTSAGAQSAVILHLVSKYAPDTPVIFIDTGYHFPETYTFLESLREKFDLNLKIYNPAITAARQEALYGRLWENEDTESLEKYGLINKVEPMNRALQDHDATAWISGVRRAHSKERAELGFFTQQKQITKIYPILDWSDDDIGTYIALHELPLHPLVDKGYASIGDWHSTKPLEAGMTAEQTRFNGVKRECGLHEESDEAEYMI